MHRSRRPRLSAFSAVACAGPVIGDVGQMTEGTSMIFRGDCSSHIKLECGEYGLRYVWYNPSNSTAIAGHLAAHWDACREAVLDAYVGMLQSNVDDETAEWGIPEWLYGDWELHIFDNFSEYDPMPAGRTILRLIFIRNGDANVPIYDVFLDDLEVTHCQPAF